MLNFIHVNIFQITFSSLYEIVTPFDRELNAIRARLNAIDNYDRTNYESMLTGVTKVVKDTWGSTVPVQIFLITDGSGGYGTGCLKDTVSTARQFPFPVKMNIISLSIMKKKEKAY